MNDNLQPLGDDHLEARITAYVLGESSPFEAAELEDLIAESPELKLFLNRTRTLHTLLNEAETTSNSPSEEWKLSSEKRGKLDVILGSTEAPIQRVTGFQKESRIRRASFRAAIGIAACFVVTFIISRFYVFPKYITEMSEPMISYMAKEDNAGAPEENIEQLRRDVRELEDKVEERRKILTTISRTKDIIYYGDRDAAGQGGSDEGSVAKAERSKQESKKTALEKSIDPADYVDAKKDFETDLAHLEKLKLKLGTDEIAADLSDEKIQIAGNKRSSGNTREVPSRPSASMAKEIAANIVSPTTIPVPDLALAEPSEDFGDGDGFGAGWGGGGASAARERNASGDTNGKLGGRDEVAKPRAKAEKSDEGKKGSLANAEMADPIAADPPGDKESNQGLRRGDAAITRNNIDAVLKNPVQDEEGDDLNFDDGVVLERIPGAPVVFGKEGKDASADDWFVKSAEDRKEKLQTAISGGEKRDIIPSVPGMPIPQTDRMKPPSPDSPLAKVRWGNGADIDQKPTGGWELAPNDMPGFGNLEKKKDLEQAKLLGEKGEEQAPAPTLAQGALKRDLEEMSEDLGREESDFSDKKRIDRFEAKLHNTLDEEVAGLASLGMSHNLDTTPQDGPREIESAQQEPRSGALTEPGQLEDAEDSDKIPDLAELPAELPLNISELRRGLDELGEPQPESGSELADYNSPVGSSFSDNLDSASARGQMTDEDNAPPSVIGLGKGSGPATGFAEMGKLPPEELDTRGEFDLAAVEKKLRELKQKIEEPSINDSNKQALFNEWKQLQAESIAKYQAQQPAIDLADLSQEIPANQEPFSTFSLNISDASFQIARAAVERGERPDPDSVKPEQFYNAVDYGDPAPSSLEPVAAAIDQTAHPVIPGRNLVRVGIRTASTGRSAAQPLRLTLLVDQSGSMVRNDRRAAMEKALEQLATLLTENDEITVIGFSRTPRLLADSMKGDKADKLPDLINQTANEGGTNLEQAINLASELALRHQLDGAQNRIVLFTDGAANLGNADPDRLADKIKDLRQQGLAFDIAGIGTNDLNDKLLAELARHGNGRYYLVGENTGASLAAQLAGAFRPAAENVKVQVKLNPQRVGSYKLIGFEKDRLKTEDFRNDSVDAAELAADEAGVAMYQVETLPEGSGEIGEVSVRFRDTASGEMVERTWTIPYDATAPAFDKAAPKTQLATLSLLAAQKLQGGPLADAISFGNFAETIARLKQTYASDPKAQGMLTLIDALK